MPLVGGSRAQSQVIGAVLIFAFVIAALAAAQVVLVPQSNEEVEFSHNQEAQQDMQELRGAIQRSAVVGASQSESVDLSADYPTRFLLLNPGEGAGTIRTAGGSSLTIENATATEDEVNDFWDGSTISAPDNRLIYSPNYNYYDSAPDTVYENSVIYNTFPDGTNISESDQDIVDDRKINLIALGGDKSTSQTGATSIDVESVSPATEKITVERDGAGNPVNVTIPTQLSEEVWVQDLLAEEIDDSADPGGPGPEEGDRCDGPNAISGTNDNDRFIVGCEYDETTTPNELTLIFQEENQTTGNPITYSLKMSKVGVGSGVTTPDADYVTDLKGDGADVALNGRQEVVFQVRNKYNNPAEDAEVDVRLSSAPSVSDDGELLHQGDSVGDAPDDDIPVGPDGKVELTYVAPGETDTSPIDIDVEAKFDTGSFGGNGPKDADISMQVINASRIDRTQPLINSPNTLRTNRSVIRDVDSADKCGSPPNAVVCRVDVRFKSISGNTINPDQFRFAFYKDDRQNMGLTGQIENVTIVGADSDGSNEFYREQDDFTSIDINIPNSDDTNPSDDEGRVTFKFKNGNGDPVEVEEGDFFVISFIIDGERQTFFIAPKAESNL